ncbi:glutaredoxin family protein [Halegenticoccus tardaugens]|uniref:glutaredoxin family protein n=1 Tax=Halegenticoccus tardaugens TaxID=2071624 RepID=UPI00100BEA78|nr:glutaredoxin family protein [Halegenticoccus tardaugens]
MSDAVEVTVYTREHCHLCEEAIETIRRVASATGTPVDLEPVDVDGDAALCERYGERVPYVTIDGRPAYKYRVDADDLRSRFESR